MEVDLLDGRVALRNSDAELGSNLLAQDFDLRFRGVTSRDSFCNARLDRRSAKRQLDPADETEHILLLRPQSVRSVHAEIRLRRQLRESNVFLRARHVGF